MPIQAATQWTEYLNCPVCENGFDLKIRLPISLGCGHTICKTCLFNLKRNQCPFDLGVITVDVEILPRNTALMLLIDTGGGGSEQLDLDSYRNTSDSQLISLAKKMESLALFLKPASSVHLSRSMQRKLITLINCQLAEDEGKLRAVRAARSLGERSVTELILHHQNPQHLSANLWAAVRGRGCQFLGPAMQEEALKLVLLALEDGEALSRKVLVMYVVQRMESQFPQASKTSIGHVVQLLYRASCFKVTKRDGDSSLMQLKEEFRTYDTLRREHDTQIVQIATESGLRIAPDQWSSLLYGDTLHKSQMQSIMDKLQTPESFSQFVQELVIALQKTGDPGDLAALRPSLDILASIDPTQETSLPDFETLDQALVSVKNVVSGLLFFISLHGSKRGGNNSGGQSASGGNNSTGADGRSTNPRYKTNMCRDLSIYGSCPRRKNCTFAHSLAELEQHRSMRKSKPNPGADSALKIVVSTASVQSSSTTTNTAAITPLKNSGPFRGRQTSSSMTPVAQVAPLPRTRKYSRQGNSTPNVGGSREAPASNLIQPVNIRGETSSQFSQHLLTDVYGNPIHYQYNVQSQPPIIQLPQPPPHYHPFINGGGRGGGGDSFHEESSMQIGESAPTMGDSNEDPFKSEDLPLEDEVVSKSIARIATKSLSALQTRKEEIIDSLEDLIGKDETTKLSQEFEELSFHNKHASNSSGQIMPVDMINPLTQQSAPATSASKSFNSVYSMWTSKSIASIVPKDFVEAAAAAAQHQAKAVNDGLDSKSTGAHLSSFEDEQEQLVTHSEDDIRPLPDVPLVSRFGPISRRCNTMLKSANPSQSQATIDDELVPTTVVKNSKQMAHQVPSLTAPWYYQNAGMSLQPIALGPNGEVGYIVLADQSGSQNSAQVVSQGPQAALFAESKRMKQELEALQNKISNLNAESFNGFSSIKNSEECSYIASQARQDQLSNELLLIENSIRDREREISNNHLQERSIPHHHAALDYGSYISQGLITSEDQDSGISGIITMASPGLTSAANGRFSDQDFRYVS